MHTFSHVPVNDSADPFAPLFREKPDLTISGPIQDGMTQEGLPVIPRQTSAAPPRESRRRVRGWVRQHRMALERIVWLVPIGLLIGGYVLAAKTGFTPDAITPPPLRQDNAQTAPVQPRSSDGPVRKKNDRPSVVTDSGRDAVPPKPSSDATALPSSASTSASASVTSSPSTSASLMAASPEVSATPDVDMTTAAPSSEPTPSTSETATTPTSAPVESNTPETSVSPTAETPAVSTDDTSAPNPS